MTTETIINLDKIESISRDGDSFKVRLEWNVEVEVAIAHPTYTGNIGMNNKPCVSRVYKAISKTTRNQTRVEIVVVSKELAQDLFNQLAKADKLGQRETYDTNRWVQRIAQ